MQGGAPSDVVLQKASDWISSALASAGRHTGPCTTSISLCTMAVWQSLTDLQDQPSALTGPSMLAHVVCLELLLYSQDIEEISNDIDIEHFTSKLLQRLPNLTAARLQHHSYSEVPHIPLLQLKHLDLELVDSHSLMRMPFAALMPALETARISFIVGLGWISELDVLGCRHLTRLVLSNAMVHQLSKLPRCWLRVDMQLLYTYNRQPSQLQQTLSEVNELILYSREFHPPQGFLAHISMPKLEVIWCDWIEDVGDNGTLSDAVDFCLGHSRNLPALKTIICEYYDISPESGIKACIPANLAGVQELIFATYWPLQLDFECARSAGEKLNVFCAIGSELRADVAALHLMNEALLKRGLTLSRVRAEPDHEDAPLQCMYIRSLSAPQLSYDDAICSVLSHLRRWGRNRECSECGTCFDCLREAGMLNNK